MTQNDVNCQLNTSVVQIDRENRQVVLSDGNTISYDRACDCDRLKS